MIHGKQYKMILHCPNKNCPVFEFDSRKYGYYCPRCDSLDHSGQRRQDEANRDFSEWALNHTVYPLTTGWEKECYPWLNLICSNVFIAPYWEAEA